MQTTWSEGSVEVRPYRKRDAEDLYGAVRASLPELGRWMNWCRPDYGPEDSRAWIASRRTAWRQGREFSFAVFEDGRFVGGCGLNQINRLHRFANLGYWVRSDCAGRGIAPAAARLLAVFGFRELGLLRLEIVVAAGNPRSMRVAEKVGAVREGTLRNRLVVQAVPCDAVLYSLIPDDLRRAPGA